MARWKWIAVAAVVAAPFAVRAIFGRGATNVRPMPAAPPAAADASGDPLPPFAVARVGSVRFRGAAFGLGWTDGGAALVSCGADGVVRVFDAETGLVRREFVAHRGVVEPGGAARSTADGIAHVLKGTVFRAVHDLPFAAAAARDGTRLVTAGPAAVSVWDVATGARVSTWPAPTGSTEALAVSDDGRVVAQGGRKERIEVRDAATRMRLAMLRNSSGASDPDTVCSIALSGDGSLLAYHAVGLHVIDVATAGEVGAVPSGETWDACALSAAGDLLVYSQSKSRFFVGDPRKLEDVRRIDAGRSAGEMPLAFSADGALVACGGESLQVLDSRAGRLVRGIALGGAEATAVAWSPDGRRLAAVCDGIVRVWRAADWTEEHAPAPPQRRAEVACLTADGRTIAVGRRGAEAEIFDARTGVHLRTVGDASGDEPWFGTWISGDRMLCGVAGGPVTVRSWRLADGAPAGTRTIESPQGMSWVAWKAPFAVRRRDDGRTEFVDVESGEVAASFENADGGMFPTLTPDRRFVVGTGPRVSVWNAATGELVVPSALPERRWGGWSGPAFSADSRSMAFAEDERVSVLDVASGQALGGFVASEADSAYPLALSPDGRVGATGGADGSVVLHDVATGDLVATLAGHRAPPRHLVFSADGRTLVSAAETVLVWDVSAWTSK